MEYKYYLSLLDHTDREIYDFICAQIRECREEFSVCSDRDTVHRVIKAIMLDDPELFWFDGKWRAEDVGRGIRVSLCYRYGYAEKEELLSRVRRTVSDSPFFAIASETEKIRAVYDWLIGHVSYRRSEADQTVEGALLHKKAVCKGIARAFQLFMNALEIPSVLVEGTLDGSEHHAWNVVFVNGEFYHVDVTMGLYAFRDRFADLGRNRRYPCFMVSDDTVVSTHRIYGDVGIRCYSDLDMDCYLAELVKIPSRFRCLGRIRYLDKGSTCHVFSIEGKDMRYALKVIRTRCGGHGFFREPMMLRDISRLDGAVPMLDHIISEDGATAYLLMPYYENLSAKLRDKNGITLEFVLRMGIGLLKAMTVLCENGIYHLDVQPKNIYFDEDGNALLGDFGGAKYESELGALGRGHGTNAFMAPEVYGSGIYGQASDIYSLGIVMYSLLNGGRLPFFEEGELRAAIMKRLSGAQIPPCTDNESVQRVINKACAFDVAERYGSYEEALADFQALAESQRDINDLTKGF